MFSCLLSERPNLTNVTSNLGTAMYGFVPAIQKEGVCRASSGGCSTCVCACECVWCWISSLQTGNKTDKLTNVLTGVFWGWFWHSGNSEELAHTVTEWMNVSVYQAVRHWTSFTAHSNPTSKVLLYQPSLKKWEAGLEEVISLLKTK